MSSNQSRFEPLERAGITAWPSRSCRFSPVESVLHDPASYIRGQANAMRTITLDQMTKSEFGEFMALILSAYVAERATADRISHGEAEGFARQQHARLLPHGQRTAGHHFLRIAAVATQEWVGGIWVYADIAGKSAFLYNITIFPTFRRQGIARDALRLLQDRVRALGRATLALNVFSTNVAAISLYKSLDFSVVSSHMNKAL